MTEVTATFETGAAGNTVATSDTGSATAWEAVTIGTAATLVYDNEHAYGALSAKVTSAGTSAACYTEWSAAAGTITDYYGRMYLYFASIPTNSPRLLDVANSAGSRSFGINLIRSGDATNPGKLQIVDASSGSLGYTTAAISTGQWVRVEFHVVNHASTGSVELKLYNDPDSETATETLSATNANTNSNSKRFRWGNALAIANVSFWMDNIVVGAAEYPGPAETLTAAPDSMSSAVMTYYYQ